MSPSGLLRLGLVQSHVESVVGFVPWGGIDQRSRVLGAKFSVNADCQRQG